MNDAASKYAIVRIVDGFEHAGQARQALLDAGFGAGDVQVHVASDEAGAVKGNFSVGNARQGGSRGEYLRNYEAERLGQCLMLVEAPDADAAARAAAILAGFGARAIDTPAAPLSGSMGAPPGAGAAS